MEKELGLEERRLVCGNIYVWFLVCRFALCSSSSFICHLKSIVSVLVILKS